MKIFKFFLFVFVLNFFISNAKDSFEPISKKLPHVEEFKYMGTEFMFSIPPAYSEPNLTSIKMYITSKEITDVKLINGNNPIINIKTQPDGITIYDISSAYLFNYSVNSNKILSSIHYDKGFYINSDYPISIYIICEFFGSIDGFFVLPYAGLGKEYIVSSYNQSNWLNTYKFPSSIAITAIYNNTILEITIGGNIDSEVTVLDENKNDLVKYKFGEKIKNIKLRKGDVFLLATSGNNQDLSGSKINSNYPISLVSGHTCANIPTEYNNCDYLIEMQLPTDMWSTEYLIPANLSRKNNCIIRIYAKEENTNVYRNGEYLFNLSNNNGLQDLAWKEMRVYPNNKNGDTQFIENALISSDKPISITYYNAAETNDVRNEFPYSLNIIPIELYVEEFTFTIPKFIQQGKEFSTHYLNLVFEIDSFDKIPDNLEIGIYDGVNTNWQKVKNIYNEKCKSFVKNKNEKLFGSIQIKIFDEGIYKIRQLNGKVIGYLHGNINNSTYGLPLNFKMIKFNTKDINAPFVYLNQELNGDISGFVKDLPDNKDIRSNLNLIYMDKSLSYNYRFHFEPIIAGQSSESNWSLSIIDSNYSSKAKLHFTDLAGNDTTVIIEYNKLPKINVNIYTIDCDSNIVNYIVENKNNYYYEWNVFGNYKILNKTNSDITIKWFNSLNNYIILKRYDNLKNFIDSNVINVIPSKTPNIIHKYKEKYCSSEIININLEFLDKNIKFNTLKVQLFKKKGVIEKIIYSQLFYENIYPQFINVFNSYLNIEGEYFVNYVYSLENNCLDSIEFSFLIIKNNTLPILEIIDNILTVNNVVGKEYLWFRNDSLVQQSENNTYKPTESGLYSCKVTDENGCLSELSNEVPIFINSIEDNQFISIKNVNKNSIELINNKESLNVNKYQIVDILGNTYPYTIENANNTITLKFNQPLLIGSYILQMSSNSNTQVYKFIINE